jgi:BASS family bile acid:Na+ symporter
MLLPAGLAFIMFALGTTLTPADFGWLLRRPRMLAAGLAGQILMVPAVAWAIVSLAGLPPPLAAGLLLLAAAPGGASSGLLTHLARGNAALSVSLTAISSVAALITMPAILGFVLPRSSGVELAGALPIGDLVRGVFLMTTIPVALGMLAKRPLERRFGSRGARAIERVAVAVFLAIVLATFFSQREAIALHVGTLAPAVVALNLVVMLLALAIGAAAGLALRDRVAIVIECGLQNSAIGIFVAIGVFHSPVMAAPSVVYALVMNLSAFGLIVLARRLGRDLPARSG